MNKQVVTVLAAAALACPTASYAAVLQITPGGTLTGATDVVVNGDLYDVLFQDGTVTSVYGGLDTANFDFQNAADAQAAANALLDQVLVSVFPNEFDSEPDTVFGISEEFDSEFFIPYGVSTPLDPVHPASIIALARNHSQEFIDSVLTDRRIRDWSNTGQPFSLEHQFNGDETVWARFTPVPEPTSLTLLGLGGLMMTNRRRR